MRCLALDFDGVLISSDREVFAVALRAFDRLRPGSGVVERWAGRELEYPLPADPDSVAFQQLTPLGNRAEDFGVALLAIETGARVEDQAGYDAFFAAQDRSWLESYHRAFYACRQEQRATSIERWIGLHRPYQPFLDLLRRRAGEAHFCIATAKDGDSVSLLLCAFGVGDLFPPQAILDKETGTAKTRHLEQISKRLRVPLTDITFVDDKLNHLHRVASLGVRCVLAAWGHNTTREHTAAHQAGFVVATLHSAEEVLFDGE